MGNRLSYIAWRLAQVIPTALIIVLLAFGLLQLAPGDAVDVVAGESGGATPEYMEEMRSLYGLDVPRWQQFANYVGALARFDLGYSFRENMPVSELLMTCLLYTSPSPRD